MNDLIFKKIFGSSMNKDIIVSFLSSILDIPNEEYESYGIIGLDF
ncbi:MAG: Rpn family recombination-promoting nuclease/putative transposase [Oscillospiraceae bacterium]|nr:Rpn family recombination-promoting nuclease/putative transposase [Oscillospiraceae bacterium]